MVLIEMTTEVSEEFPTGHTREYIWMLGQSWPIPAADDPKIVRMEAFGEELDTIGPRFSGGQILRGGTPERDLCRTWRLNDARYVSEQMRMFYP